MDTASSKPDDLVLALPSEQLPTTASDTTLQLPGLPQDLFQELWRAANAEACGLAQEELGIALTSVGAKLNHGLPPGGLPGSIQKAAFYRSLHLSELALAHACALGREQAWERFLHLYRASLIQAAVSITGSVTLGTELADSLYAELYGLREREGERRSPFASYSGRGSLLAWLRTTLVQRHRDHYRRTHRETELDDTDGPAQPEAEPVPAELARLKQAVARILGSLGAEDRYLLVAYFLDRDTLLKIARILHVHEATISRRLKRLVARLRNELLRDLRSHGLSKAAAEETLGADPRDIEINIRALLQSSQTASFSNQTGPTAVSDPL